ncbi:hypothetical protein [Leptolyngbya sp. FACHB-17]|uniref:hypothetical protein n=1 Tax=unclassified Leptolyngbya TaxID=2650499 RepID=UPI0016818734|nr:hypothetical protein [Leptolyngbya sp. FACHB-17]MBD2079134.1 hypothetical protein [Leptolyngbya sp. FACHB-17]
MPDSFSHRSSPTKTNTNQNGLIDADPGNTPTEPDFTRDDQDVTPVNEATFERPQESSTEKEQKQS